MELREVFSPIGVLRSLKDGLPPGPGRFPYLGLELSLSAMENPLGTMLQWVHDYGRVFTTRFLGTRQVWMIGPEANQYILVDNAQNFSWEHGHLGDLIPFIGLGLLTTDGAVHDRARRLLLPVFSRRRMDEYAERMVDMARRAVDQLEVGSELDIFRWSRQLTLRVATTLLLGMDADAELCRELSTQFVRGLRFYGVFFHLQFLRGPGTPFAGMKRARGRIDRVLLAEIGRRRRRGSNGENILDILINARDDGDRFTDEEVRDQVMTLLFAGHDTTTATVTWMMSLLGRHRYAYERLVDELDAELGDGPAEADHLTGGLPYLDQALAETLRLYPPAWIGPRRAVEDFEFQGHRVPGGTHVAYSSWLSHHLEDVFPNPEMFDPGRFAAERVKALPAGAYVPFGRGRRLCIGMRFGEIESKALATALLQRFHVELVPGQSFKPRTIPTISPAHGVKIRLRRRDEAPWCSAPASGEPVSAISARVS